MRTLITLLMLALSVNVFAAKPDRTATGPIQISECQAITESGSYVVTKNLTATGDCLVLQADFITIDLGGFTLFGDGTGDGVTGVANVVTEGNVVRNGKVTGFVNGIDFSFAMNCVVENIQAIDNDVYGIWTYDGCRSERNTATLNIFGIEVGDGGIAVNNIVRSNSNDGIKADTGSLIQGNTITANRRHGIAGSPHISLIGNLIHNNEYNGINGHCPSNILNNTITNNDVSNLVLTGSGCNLSGNLISP